MAEQDFEIEFPVSKINYLAITTLNFLKHFPGLLRKQEWVEDCISCRILRDREAVTLKRAKKCYLKQCCDPPYLLSVLWDILSQLIIGHAILRTQFSGIAYYSLDGNIRLKSINLLWCLTLRSLHGCLTDQPCPEIPSNIRYLTFVDLSEKWMREGHFIGTK